MGQRSLEQFYPALSKLEPEARTLLSTKAMPFVIAKGTEVFAPGQSCRGYLLLSRGVVRVQSVSKEGREALLYRVCPGEICIQTSLNLLGEETYSAEAISEDEIEGVLLDPASFDRLLATSPVFRKFVFSSISKRLKDITQTVERIAFEPIEVRLADNLLMRKDDTGRVEATHLDLARDLGTAREVVSRHLERMAQKGVVRTSRGVVLIVDETALERLCR
ncbi:Crp/Fnr family transcriptional regulator [Cohaesibacter gelatinilyticus]|uniref:CRP/FNR family transcriptional regulator, anaerobic regulatory protein n=1 Tax=Cohaesibacter gelatinilyticus TaxID=372072 RepID=A0A285PGQ7_9HYPH|nr:Crp/Fnr family transcriptional regulator [Cohaesibacter gelatinilyticus]SNZ20884.1 CRP/FNR family transcriptional regulator, anaerobic regulatory protein [Cohaesibacter gelatinilyticus]